VPEREQRVTPLELFFDLVFVFGLTQVTNLMSADPTWHGLGRGLLVLAALWWTWTGYAWLTNTLEPEEGAVRAGMVAAMAALLVVALAVPNAFGDDAVVFAVAFLIVRLLHLFLYAIAWKRDPDLLDAVLRLIPPAVVAPGILIAAGFLDGRAQAALWIGALVMDYVVALIAGGEGWRVAPAHFSERHGLIVIIALGESIVSIGIGAAGVTLTPSVVAAAALAIVAIAALWWAYFDVYAVMSERQLARMSGAARVRFARDHYSYLHMPMIAGVVLFALGLKKTIEHVGDPLETVPAVALCGGVALYFLTHVVMRLRSVYALRRGEAARDLEQDSLYRQTPGWFGVGRPAATIAALALIPAALVLPALAALTLVTAVCCALIVYDVVHYRDERMQVREARP
jgi:low temperature requirement protein LtrA